MTSRQKVTAFIVNAIADIIPGDRYNADLTQQRLDAMSDAEFDQYIRSLAKPETEEGRATQEILPFYSPNLKDPRITMENLLVVADKIGHKFFQQLWLTDPHTGRVFLTPQKYLVLDMTVRRQAQMLTKKSSIPENARHVDEMSGQVTGKSKGSKISFPELQAQLAQGLENTLIEEIKVRGGDRTAQVEFDRQLIEHGEASISDVTAGGGVTKSTSSVAILFRGAMIDNNMDEV
ncbi:putative virion-associated RNA polymerase subunit beta/beta' [Pseudomonas phage pPa_SNUABM_DT01]|nr:putative virion-associated RNA polymerase subunit beta/beta' [Pseudomonas phage pPa_SNUABM_DT01]